MKRNYVVVLVFALSLLLLTSCVAKNAESAETKLSDKGYYISIDKSIVPSLIEVRVGVKAISCMHAIDYEGGDVYAIYFSDSQSARDAKGFIEGWSKGYIDNAEVKQSGSCIYFGTEKGLKDFE